MVSWSLRLCGSMSGVAVATSPGVGGLGPRSPPAVGRVGVADFRRELFGQFASNPLAVAVSIGQRSCINPTVCAVGSTSTRCRSEHHTTNQTEDQGQPKPRPSAATELRSKSQRDRPTSPTLTPSGPCHNGGGTPDSRGWWCLHRNPGESCGRCRCSGCRPEGCLTGWGYPTTLTGPSKRLQI